MVPDSYFSAGRGIIWWPSPTRRHAYESEATAGRSRRQVRHRLALDAHGVDRACALAHHEHAAPFRNGRFVGQKAHGIANRAAVKSDLRPFTAEATPLRQGRRPLVKESGEAMDGRWSGDARLVLCCGRRRRAGSVALLGRLLEDDHHASVRMLRLGQ